MCNRRGMVVGFDRDRARLCGDCNNACDNACPMRLKPRTVKRSMFTCTQCAQCLGACEQVQSTDRRASLLHWVADERAVAVATSRPVGNSRARGSTASSVNRP